MFNVNKMCSLQKGSFVFHFEISTKIFSRLINIGTVVGCERPHTPDDTVLQKSLLRLVRRGIVRHFNVIYFICTFLF